MVKRLVITLQCICTLITSVLAGLLIYHVLHPVSLWAKLANGVFLVLFSSWWVVYISKLTDRIVVLLGRKGDA